MLPSWKLMIAAVLATMVLAASADSSCQGNPNNFAIATKDPILIKSVENGQLFIAKDDLTGNSLRVMHVYGTAYQMGFAQALLVGPEIVQMLADYEQYLVEQAAALFPKLPPNLRKIAAEKGIAAAMELTADITKPFTPQRYFDEAHGIVDALNGSLTYDQFYRFQMFPEVIKASCSMFGVWGQAIAETQGTLYQLRALDFGTDSPLVDHPILVVYHPTDGFPFASLTWVGFIGSVTAYSGAVGVSEKVWLHYNETSSRAGVPFHFLMRDIAQYDRTIDDAINRMTSSTRTCSVFLGVGSAHDQQFRACEYAHEFVRVYDDANYPAYPPVHPLMNGVVFVDKHTQPSDDPCLGGLLQQYYGTITPQLTIQSILGPFQTGDLHAAIYDFNANFMYVSVAGPAINSTGHMLMDEAPASAYDRPWIRFDAEKLLTMTQ